MIEAAVARAPTCRAEIAAIADRLSRWTPRAGCAAARPRNGRGDASRSMTGRLPPNTRRLCRSMSIARRPGSQAGTRCFRAPPRMIRRGTARSPT